MKTLPEVEKEIEMKNNNNKERMNELGKGGFNPTLSKFKKVTMKF